MRAAAIRRGSARASQDVRQCDAALRGKLEPPGRGAHALEGSLFCRKLQQASPCCDPVSPILQKCSNCSWAAPSIWQSCKSAAFCPSNRGTKQKRAKLMYFCSNSCFDAYFAVKILRLCRIFMIFIPASRRTGPSKPHKPPCPPAASLPSAEVLPPAGRAFYWPTRTKTLLSGASMTATWPDSVGKGWRIQLISVLADSAS